MNALGALEMKIAEQVRQEREAIYGDAEVEAQEDTELYDRLQDAIKEFVETFPRTQNGSRFINSFCTLKPVLKVRFSHLKELFAQSVPGSLFLDEVGKSISVGPLFHPLLGAYTRCNYELQLTNIRVSNASSMKPNEFANLPIQRAKKVTILNKVHYSGAIDTNPALKKTEIVADIVFGDLFKKNDVVIPIETEESQDTTKLLISLPEIRSKIDPVDGTFTQLDSRSCELSRLYGDVPLCWVNHELELVVPFGV